MRLSRDARASIAAAVLLVMLHMTACASPVTQDLPTPVASSSPSPSASAQGPVESYLAWLAASRVPDAATACAALSPKLQERLIAQLNAQGVFAVSTCEQLVEVTAQAYKATGQSADVDVVVQSQTATDATLFVTYRDGGDCGTVVMNRQGADWIITEESEECGE